MIQSTPEASTILPQGSLEHYLTSALFDSIITRSSTASLESRFFLNLPNLPKELVVYIEVVEVVVLWVDGVSVVAVVGRASGAVGLGLVALDELTGGGLVLPGKCAVGIGDSGGTGVADFSTEEGLPAAWRGRMQRALGCRSRL